jgi:WD40-like Beta Propeller Repeat
MNRLCRTTSIAVVQLLTVPLIVSSISAAPKFSEWSAPINLGPTINSTFDDAGPAISKDGLTLYFHSNRPGGSGNFDIWLSRRDSVEDSWGVPVNLGPTVNSTFNDLVPGLSRDGHYLFFTSDRPGGSGDLDLWVSRREHTHEDFGDFGWQPPMNLGGIVNTAAIDAGPSYFENEDMSTPLLFFASNRPGGPGGLDIYVSEQNADGSFGAAVPVTELNTELADQAQDLRHDGLEMFIMSNRAGTRGLADLWVSTRNTTFDQWSPPTNVGSLVNTAFNEGQPSLSSDGRTLYFFSNRPGGSGGNDLYMTTRTRKKGGR